MRAIDKFLDHFDGNQSKAAKALLVKQQNIWWWKNKSKDMPLEYVPRASKAIGMTPSDLRPDIFN